MKTNKLIDFFARTMAAILLTGAAVVAVLSIMTYNESNDEYYAQSTAFIT